MGLPTGLDDYNIEILSDFSQQTWLLILGAHLTGICAQILKKKTKA